MWYVAKYNNYNDSFLLIESESLIKKRCSSTGIIDLLLSGAKFHTSTDYCSINGGKIIFNYSDEFYSLLESISIVHVESVSSFVHTFSIRSTLPKELIINTYFMLPQWKRDVFCTYRDKLIVKEHGDSIYVWCNGLFWRCEVFIGGIGGVYIENEKCYVIVNGYEIDISCGKDENIPCECCKMSKQEFLRKAIF